MSSAWPEPALRGIIRTDLSPPESDRMEQAIDHDQLDAALKRCGATWDAAQTHGLLSGRLAVAGVDSGFEWLSQVLEGTDSSDVLRNECEVLLSSLFESTYRQLSERRSEFAPLLPDDEDNAPSRAAALGRWCEGFLHGLVSNKYADALRERLSAEPLEDIIRDMLQITRATVEDDNDAEADEAAYTELVEYLRVAAQLAYEELAEFRRKPGNEEETDAEAEVLH